MKKILLIVLLLSCLIFQAMATHQRAGEISYRYLSGTTYEITIVTYSYAPSLADRYELEINWGDNTTSVLPRSNGSLTEFGFSGEIVGPDIKRNLYVGTHTYPGASTYKISVEDPNRNYGVLNIPNSVEVPLYIETELIINPYIGSNSSPQLLLPPIDQGCVDQLFIHNPGAFDPDGDSLSFRLTTCRGAGGENIPGFQLPNQIGANAGGTFTINSRTGEILWQSPKMKGEYNIAFVVEEWRLGIKIGYLTRDMQITIGVCDNNPPVLIQMADTCVEAGKQLLLPVIATDIDHNAIKLTAAGAPFEIPDPAVFESDSDSLGHNTGYFFWQTKCSHIRKNAYQVYFKATDNDLPVNLFDLKTVNIRVIGPAPLKLTATPLGNLIRLTWQPPLCSGVKGYNIYRRSGFSGYVHGYCETGLPSYTGYSFIQAVGAADTTFTDMDLSRGIDYCYMVVALYNDDAEGYASNETCAMLKKDVAVITNVSILNTDKANGSIYTAWSKPTEIDVVQAPGPYKYLIYRSEDIGSNNFVLVDSLASLNDTVYTDSGLNTLEKAYTYRIDVYNVAADNRFLIGSSQAASSIFITFEPTDKKLKINFNKQVPWTNELYVIYKLNSSTSTFDSIGNTYLTYYTDGGLTNGTSYCYKVKAIGTYGTSGITDPLINFSQEACSVPVDNEPPCPPVLQVASDCDKLVNSLNWFTDAINCPMDVVKYVIYFQPPGASKLVLLDSTDQLFYSHNNLVTMAGCYGLVAVDYNGNRSVMSDTICVPADICGKYHLPNIFSPNNDERNDLFIPFPYSGVEKIDIQIYNRWGNLLFATTDPNIKWDGKIQGSQTEVPDGVYYYICDVFEISFNGVTKRTLKGSILLVR